MVIFVLKRVAFAIVTLLVATWIAFVLVHLSGSTPGGVALGQSATPEQVVAYNESIGWYDPWIVQYLDWVGQVLQGNLGVSLIDGRPIGPDIAKRLPVTAALALFGTLAQRRRRHRARRHRRGPRRGRGPVHHRPLRRAALRSRLLGRRAPRLRLRRAAALAAGDRVRAVRRRSCGVGQVARAARADRSRSPRRPASRGRRGRRCRRRSRRSTCARCAPSGRPTTRIVYVHALRGASLPILAIVAIQFIVLFGGSVVIEVLFALPGIGQAMQAAVGSADLPFVQALVLVATLVVVVVNLALELLNRTLDPKLRAS